MWERWREEAEQLRAYEDLFISSPSSFSSSPAWPTCLSFSEHFKLNLTTLFFLHFCSTAAIVPLTFFPLDLIWARLLIFPRTNKIQ